MSGYIPVPPDGWVPTATDATTKLFPTDTMTALSATMDAAVGLIPALENVPAQGFGHSFLASAVNLNPGPGADIGGHALERVAIRCRTAAMSNLAQGGTRSDQILTSIQTNRTPNTRGIVFLGGGHRNDQNYYTNATPNYATVAAVFRSIFANLTARQYDLYSSAAFQFGAGWASGSSSTAGAYVDVAFAGDRAFIAFSAVTGAGGTFIVKNAANATIATVTTGGYGVAFRGMAEVSGLGAGNHTVRVIVQSGTVGIAGIVIPAATPPLIVWELEPPYNEAVVSGGALANTVNAGYQAATTAVAAEFSWASIVTVTAPPTWDASVDTTPDGVHPSASGHRKIADWAITRMKAAGVTFRQGLNWLTGTEADPTTYTVPTVAYQKTGATAPAAPVLTATTGIAIAHTWNLPDDGGATLTSLVLEYSANGTTGWATKATYGPTVTTSNV
ncbi:MAG TPA: SGNH/GDSL hydrolase family protein, partial [Mycobacterium sp.]